MAAKTKSPGAQSVGQIDDALKELRRGEPVIDTVEQGLNAAKAVGVPVALEGPKPPASALAVTLTGFGPAQVAPRKPAPPAKRVPPVSPVGKAGAAAPKVRGSGSGKGTVGAAPPTARAGGGGGGAGSVPVGSAALSGEQLLQPPVPPTSIRPEDDPGFAQVKARVKAVAKDKRAHPPASSKAKEAQHAALPPADDLGAQAKAAKVETMDAQQAGSFDKKAFIAAVKAAIEAKSPKTLKEADDYKKSGKAGDVKGEVKGLVTQGKEGQAKDIEAATDAPPDQSKAVPKPVAPMVAEKPGAAVSVPAAGAVPKPAPAEQTNLAAGKHEANQEMAEAGVSDQQLAESNEPEFQKALSDKKAAAAHAESAPGAYRQAEQQVLQQGRAQASEVTTGGVAGMQSSKAAALAGLAADKEKTKTKDEAKRAQVTARIQGIFAATEADVKKALDGIDPKVEAEFTRGEAAARRTFEAYVAMKMAAYKADRYSGVLGGLRWAKDKLLGMPAKVNEFFAAGRELYLKAMERVITRVADVVGNALTAAKRRIAKGRADIAAYVKGLPADLKNVGSEASQEIGERFEQLTASVDAKQDSVVDTLATKYVEARTGLDERVEALQAENRGLVDKAIGAIKGVINTIRELANMLRTALARASSVVGEIVKKPVAFLKNLIAGVKGGILRFKDNIVGHLKKGLLSWLFGALAAGGIELPERFDLKGIINLVSSVFGLTWRAIRQRIARRIGEPVMGAVEKGVDIFQKLAAEGVGGLWQMVVEKVGDIKAMLVEKVQDLVITQVITAGIKWLISLLNPAAAFIKACKLIYDVVMFFVNNARRIVHFVSTVIGSVVDIVRGNVSGVVDKVEGALSQMVPILIGFLASVLGLGGLGEKVREIVMTLQKPVKKAVDWIIGVGLKLAAPVIRGLKGLGGRARAKIASGKAWAKGKAEAGKKWARRKAEAGRGWLRGDSAGAQGQPPARTRHPTGVEQPLEKAAADADEMLKAPGADRSSIVGRLQQLKRDHGLARAELVSEPDGEVHVTVQRATRSTPSRRIIQKRLRDVDIHRMIRAIARELLESPSVRRAVDRILHHRAKGLGKPGNEPRPGEGKAAESAAPRPGGGSSERVIRASAVTQTRQTWSSSPGHQIVEGLGRYRPDIIAAIAGIKSKTGASDADLARALRRAHAGKVPSPQNPISKHPDAVSYVFRLARLEEVEASRSPSHLVGSSIAHEVTIASPETTAEEMMTGYNPMSDVGASAASRGAYARVGLEHPSTSTSTGTNAQVTRFLEREMSLAVAYVETIFHSEYQGDFSEQELDHIAREQLRGRLKRAALSEAGASE